MTKPSPETTGATNGVFLRCPVCNDPLLPDQFDLISDAGPSGLHYYVQCSRCLHALQGTFMLARDGMSFVGMLTDMLKDDILRFQDASPITSDDVLALYEIWHT